MTAPYYADKLNLLADIFGAREVSMVGGGVSVDGRFLPVLDDVIIAMAPDRLPDSVRARIERSADGGARNGAGVTPFAADVRDSFGDEWTSHPKILAEHEDEFRAYFDLVDLEAIAGLRVADLGCGSGRWSWFLAGRCREIVLVDYSQAIFVARRNLAGARNAVFVMADVLDLPFRPAAFDLVACLGVLHHLPVDALTALRRLAVLAPRHLVYLYYALDNRPRYFRWVLSGVTVVRRALSRVRSRRARAALTSVIASGVYLPLARMAPMLHRARLDRFVPLAETYRGKSLERLRQDVYDRFFTSIEQRFSRRQIQALSDCFSTVTISDELPYWHFLCEVSAVP